MSWSWGGGAALVAPPEDGSPGPFTDATVILDEVDMLCTAGQAHPALHRLIHYGRHQRVNLVATARRPQDMYRGLTSQADTIVAFRADELLDLEYLKSKRLDPAEIEALAPLEFVTNNPESEILRSCCLI